MNDFETRQDLKGCNTTAAGRIGAGMASNLGTDPEDFRAEMRARTDREIRTAALHAALAIQGGRDDARGLVSNAATIESYLRNGRDHDQIAAEALTAA